MTDLLPSSQELVTLCRTDGEFSLAARSWHGGVRLEVSGPGGVSTVTGVRLVDGSPQPDVPASTDTGVVTLAGPSPIWARILMPVPPRFFNDVAAAVGMGLARHGEDLTWWQYLPAVQRLVEMMRPPAPGALEHAVDPSPPAGAFDAPTGRYLHLDLDGVDHRLYFEEAGSGVPLLLQHTAGAHGQQWRHLFEERAITDHFRLIAYDLPFHGKSIPPLARRWWEEQYRPTGAQLRAVPLALASALHLDRPAFMGCSVGGLLALDLALRHPDRFRAVISVEGALAIPGRWDRVSWFWHPQVSNESKARLMEGLMSPTSPTAFRKETSQVYASGWPPAFLGDLWYYLDEYDLRDRAGEIDTDRIQVHILNGEYDHSGTVELGRAAHEAIAGSTFTEMAGVGHFPMSENPSVFVEHLLPVLDRIRRDQ